MSHWSPEALSERFGAALARVTWPSVLAVAVCAALPAVAADRAQARAIAIIDKGLEDRVEPYIRASAARDTSDISKWLAVGGMIRMWRIATTGSASLTVSVDNPTSYNIATAATAAGYDLTKPLNILVTINTGIYVNRVVATNFSFASGTSLKIVNNGFICGTGGVGNAGNGGDAIAINFPFAIDNTNGFVLAGGGGGGLGGVASPGSLGECQGGGGGGGFGYPVGAGGGPNGSGNPGTNGQPGDRTILGIGGYGGSGGHDSFYGFSGGGGGNGGGAGLAGSQGGYASDGGFPSPGGNPGLAVNTLGGGGNSIITWVGGFNGTQVRGLIV